MSNQTLRKKLLIIDTATSPQYFMITGPDRPVVVEYLDELILSKDLVAKLDIFLNSNNVLLKDLDAICAGAGPGSFTGIRAGISVANALAFALKRPLITYCSLIGYADQRGRYDEYYSAFDARNGGVYLLKQYKDNFNSIPFQSDGSAIQKLPIFTPHKDSLEPKYPHLAFNEAKLSENRLISYLEHKILKKDVSSPEKISPYYLKPIEE